VLSERGRGGVGGGEEVCLAVEIEAFEAKNERGRERKREK